MSKDILIGCSSFNNQYWKGIFYPEDLPSSKWFDFYCQHFDTYEFNGSFYKFPTVKALNSWYYKSPDDFLFSVKVFKGITHSRRFNECADSIADFYSVCKEGLMEKLGCILFQFPPSYDYNKEKLNEIVRNLNPNFKNVVEFRHESWWNDEVWETFLIHDITFCSVSYPKLPQTIFTESKLIYVRLHGNLDMFYSHYTLAELNNLKSKIDETKTFVYFNNTAGTAGILNALELKKISFDII